MTDLAEALPAYNVGVNIKTCFCKRDKARTIVTTRMILKRRGKFHCTGYHYEQSELVKFISDIILFCIVTLLILRESSQN
jgi:hypothetical protein